MHNSPKALVSLPLFFLHFGLSYGLLQSSSSASENIPAPYDFGNQSQTQLSPATALSFGTSLPSSTWHASTPPPSPTPSKNCSEEDQNCLEFPFDLTDQCMLWNTSCTGNTTEAINTFFGTTAQQLEHDGSLCWVDNFTESGCGTSWAEAQALVSWMRTPQCLTTMKAWTDTPQGASIVWDWNEEWNGHIEVFNDTSCCGSCGLTTQNVNVYYWPEPDADTSCLDLVGTSVQPLDYGGTTGYDGQVYWGCYSQVSGGTLPVTDLVTTAILAPILSPPVTVKLFVENPWSPSACVQSATSSAGSATSASSLQPSNGVQSPSAPIRARAHSIIMPPSVTQQGGVPVSTVVSAGFTFTSPFVYVEFSYLSAAELSCPGTQIDSTMLKFTSGELSTLEYATGGEGDMVTKSFDFGDLPCPPQSVMERKWYKPEPGQPYRPWLAAPKQKFVDEIAPWFSNCDVGLFTGYDPPRTLVPAVAMAEGVTSIDPPNTTTAPMPSLTRESGARKTANAHDPVVTPTNTATSMGPKESGDQGLIPSKPSEAGQSNHAGGSGGDLSEAEDPHGSSDPVQTNSATGIIQKSEAEAGTTESGSPKTVNEDLSNYNPSHLLPEQMSQIESAIAIAQPEPTAAQYQETSPWVNDPSQTKATVEHDGTADQGTNMDKPSGSGYTTEAYDPSRVLPDQMSKIDSALALTPQGSTPAQNQESNPQQSEYPLAGYTVTEQDPYQGNVPDSVPSQTLEESYLSRQAKSDPSATLVSEGSYAQAISKSGTDTLPNVPVAGDVKTMNGEIIAPFSNGISILGATLTPGAQAMTMSGDVISLARSALFIGTDSVGFVPDMPESVFTTVAGQAVVANPTAVDIAGSTLSPGGPNAIVSGTTVALNSDSELVVGSKTVAFASSKANLGEIILGALGTGGLSSSDASPTSVRTGPASITEGRSFGQTESASIAANSSNILNTSLVNDTGSSASNTGSSSIDTVPSSTNSAQVSPSAARGKSIASTSEAASPYTHRWWKVVMASVAIVPSLMYM